MSSDKKEQDVPGIHRRDLLKVGAAGIAAAGVGMNTAWAQPRAQGAKQKTNSKTGNRVAIITDAQLNIGPHLARKFARLNYSLVIADVLASAEIDLEVGASCTDAATFTDGVTSSGLSFNCATDLGFSSQGGGGAPFTYNPYSPAPPSGLDPAVTGLQFTPTGTMNADTGAGTPSFTITYEVQIE